MQAPAHTGSRHDRSVRACPWPWPRPSPQPPFGQCWPSLRCGEASSAVGGGGTSVKAHLAGPPASYRRLKSSGSPRAATLRTQVPSALTPRPGGVPGVVKTRRASGHALQRPAGSVAMPAGVSSFLSTYRQDGFPFSAKGRPAKACRRRGCSPFCSLFGLDVNGTLHTTGGAKHVAAPVRPPAGDGRVPG